LTDPDDARYEAREAGRDRDAFAAEGQVRLP
jgi:hypothetical protein